MNGLRDDDQEQQQQIDNNGGGGNHMMMGSGSEGMNQKGGVHGNDNGNVKGGTHSFDFTWNTNQNTYNNSNQSSSQYNQHRQLQPTPPLPSSSHQMIPPPSSSSAIIPTIGGTHLLEQHQQQQNRQHSSSTSSNPSLQMPSSSSHLNNGQNSEFLSVLPSPFSLLPSPFSLLLFIDRLGSSPHLPIPGASKARSFSDIASDLMEKRKESFDALNISEMIFDDLHHSHNGHNSSHHPSSGTEADLSIFEELLYGNEGGNNGQRRTMRFDSLLNDSMFSDSNEQRDDDDDVDLSAYATLAQSLQTNKPSKGGSPLKDSSRLVSIVVFLSSFFFLSLFLLFFASLVFRFFSLSIPSFFLLFFLENQIGTK
jgi:hypothetical protein